jgi:RNA-directed DNA polymerase
MPKEQTRRPTRILSKSALRAAWNYSKDKSAKAGAAGTDEVTARSFASNLDANLDRLARSIADGSFGFSTLRPCAIPKANSNKERLICVPTVGDRLVQRCVAMYLASRKLLPIYNSSSFGFLPDLGLEKAINRTLDLRSEHDFVFETDIEKFFDKIDRPQLRELLRKELKQHSILPILEKAIRTEVKPTANCSPEKLILLGIRRGVGVRQGMPLSPVFANVALSGFDRAVEKAGIRMVRYADDIVAFASSKIKITEAAAFIERELLCLGHSIPSLSENGKTKIAGRLESFEFLGREIAWDNRYGRYVQRVSNAKIQKIKNKLEDEFGSEQTLNGKSNFADFASSLKKSIGSYLSSYSDVSNYPLFEAELRSATIDILRDVYAKIFGQGALRRVTAEHRKFLGIEDISFPVTDVDDFY